MKIKKKDIAEKLSKVIKKLKKKLKGRGGKARKKALIALVCVILCAALFFFISSKLGLFDEDNEPETQIHEITAPDGTESSQTLPQDGFPTYSGQINIKDIPAYSGHPYIKINEGIPFFTEADLSVTSFESYSKKDRLGRCGTAFANVCKELMPTSPREDISSVKPSGWTHTEYSFIDGKTLYNRCHLIGFQLTGENANDRNLITGTRYMNTSGMLPFENMVADYVKETGNHVLYRVTPLFDGNDLVASGVMIEAESVEDRGDGILFNVYCYNVQPGVSINYRNGKSKLEASKYTDIESTYILNTERKIFHLTSCETAKKIPAENKKSFTGKISDLAEMGYKPCLGCEP